jgi:muramoyltetrapeptide carboxypeptidase LdcA involved in peptidoglycan recycling
MPLVHPPKARPGDKVAIVSPAFAAPAVAPEVHEQGVRRLVELTGLVPVEYPTTRQLDAPASDRARDLNAAFADPSIRAIVATIGGDDQITVIPHLAPDLVRADPKPFLGYSDNTNLLCWLWTHGVAAFHGGSVAVHLGPGPALDPEHAASLTAALMTGGRLEITEPGEAEDYGLRWDDPAALRSYGDREPTEPWTWSGPARTVTGPTWGGCIEVLQWILAAGRFPSDPAVLAGHVLLVESSEDQPSATEVGYILRSMGERGLLSEVVGVLAARPAASDHEHPGTPESRKAFRDAQREAVIDTVHRYNPDVVLCVGVPFGHTRPQWILPYGGEVTLDGVGQRVFADFG